MSIFGATDAPCGIFGPTACTTGGMLQSLTFRRAGHLVAGTAPVQNAAGEVVVSYVSLGPITGELQPMHDGLQRQLGGVVVEVAYVFYVPGNPGLRAGDRTYIDGAQVEIVAANQYGTDHLEALLRFVGR